MKQSRKELNRFLVEAFHSVLRAEERYLRGLHQGDLSISEMHVIEACSRAASQGKGSAKGIANMLGITPGSLSSSLNVLEKKGYLERRRDSSDGRRIHISLTDKGRRADAAHMHVHEKMIDAVLTGLDDGQTESLIQALQVITHFFAQERTNE